MRDAHDIARDMQRRQDARVQVEALAKRRGDAAALAARRTGKSMRECIRAGERARLKVLRKAGIGA